MVPVPLTAVRPKQGADQLFGRKVSALSAPAPILVSQDSHEPLPRMTSDYHITLNLVGTGENRQVTSQFDGLLLGDEDAKGGD